MNYLSFFSGIGGFELALQRTFGDKAKCVGYSEINPTALGIYERHFPNHEPLGDITKITPQMITELYRRVGHIDLIVGGFPCQNLSLANTKGERNGLDGAKSGLFFQLLKIMNTVSTLNKATNRKTFFILENVRGMGKYRTLITKHLSESFDGIVETELNSKHFSAQQRIRYIWTNFPVKPVPSTLKGPVLADILAPQKDVLKYINELQYSDQMLNYLNAMVKVKNATPKGHYQVVCSKPDKDHVKLCHFKQIKPSDPDTMVRWMRYAFSDTANEKSRTIASQFPHVLVDRRFGTNDKFMVRSFFSEEIESLFTFPQQWTKYNSQGKLMGKTANTRKRLNVLGNSVVVDAIKYITDALSSQF
jgi:DNA-cytosine methyltransferase